MKILQSKVGLTVQVIFKQKFEGAEEVSPMTACGSLEVGWNGTEMCLQGWVPPLVRRAFFCHHEKSFPSIVIVFWTGLPVSARERTYPRCTRPRAATEHTLDHQTLAELQLRENQWLVFILIFIGISLFFGVLVSAGEQSESSYTCAYVNCFSSYFPIEVIVLSRVL